MTDVCLSLLGAPELEENLLDHLLMSPAVATFTSQRIASHGGHPAELDPGEQVLGRGEAVLVLAVLDAADVERLLVELREAFAGSGLRYWQCPVLSQGEL